MTKRYKLRGLIDNEFGVILLKNYASAINRVNVIPVAEKFGTFAGNLIESKIETDGMDLKITLRATISDNVSATGESANFCIIIEVEPEIIQEVTLLNGTPLEILL